MHPTARCRAAVGWALHILSAYGRLLLPKGSPQEGSWGTRARLFPCAPLSSLQVLTPLEGSAGTAPAPSSIGELDRGPGHWLLLPHPQRQPPVTC